MVGSRLFASSRSGATMLLSELLSGDERFALEDICADYTDVISTPGTASSVQLAAAATDKVGRLVGVSERISSDKSFAIQARRKFVPQIHMRVLYTSQMDCEGEH